MSIQSLTPPEKPLEERIAALLEHEIYATRDGRLMTRQAPDPRYPDDDDSWGEVKSHKDLLYTAAHLIRVIQRASHDRPE